jgi:D-amino-acid dehydrogenase
VLGAAIGDPALIREDGDYVAWEIPARATAGRGAWGSAAIGTATLRDARADEVAAIDRLIEQPIAGAIRFAGTGRIADLGRLADALEDTLVASGGRITQRAAQVIRDGDCAEIPGSDADLILVTAGVASGAMLRAFGHRAPIIAERGYHIRGTSTRWPADMPPIVFEDRSMIVTRYDDQVQAASFVELGTPDAPPDPRKWERLLRHVRELGLPIEGPYTR